MQVNAHLHFDGRCEAAFKFYEKCLGGKITVMMTYGETPMAAHTPPEWHKKIVHATLSLGEYRLTGADVPADQYEKPKGMAVLLNVNTAGEAERIFHTLAENGTVQMPLRETFWAKRFGMLTDQFGTPWLINCGQLR